jgi:hypothetical protein
LFTKASTCGSVICRKKECRDYCYQSK